MAQTGVTLVLMSLLATLSKSQSAPMVELTTGTIRGTVVEAAGTQVNAFLGIPYAKPPVGELRFKPPVPAEPWEGVYNATELPNNCYQRHRPNEEYNRSEDCLYLNVWQYPTQPQGAAVMVSFHGGGFIAGDGADAEADGRFPATTQQVLIVTMNFRLGALGFLALGTDDAPGNMGLLDQRLALQWVRDNIARFGGNPDRVTVVGQSSGAAAAHFHALSPMSSGLVQRAILQSGSAFSPWALTPRDVAMTRGRDLASRLGCRQPEVREMVACLRKSPAKDIIDNQYTYNGLVKFPFTPVVDGKFLPAHPSEMAIPSVDVLAGFTTNEGSKVLTTDSVTKHYFNLSSASLINKEQYIETIQTLLPELNEFGEAAVEFEYGAWANLGHPAMYRDAAENVVGDYAGKCPMIEGSRMHAEAGGKVYLYQFNHIASVFDPSPWAGIQHGAEQLFVLGLPLDRSLGFTEEETGLARKVMQLWANFAKSGNPNGPGNEVWPAYNQTNQTYVVLDTGPVRVEQRPRARPCLFWRSYLWRLQQRTAELSDKCSNVPGGQPWTAHPASLTHIILGILLQYLFKYY